MIPKRIRSKYQPISARESADACFTTGMLVCCGVSDFSLRAGGDVRKSVFGKMYLLSENEGVVLDAQCSRCGQMFSVFDSALDGYDACTNAPVNPAPAAEKEIRCVKCQGKHFAVRLAYEYPGRQELETLDIPEPDNAFSWIWVSLACCSCGREYKNFLSFETA